MCSKLDVCLVSLFVKFEAKLRRLKISQEMFSPVRSVSITSSWKLEYVTIELRIIISANSQVPKLIPRSLSLHLLGNVELNNDLTIEEFMNSWVGTGFVVTPSEECGIL